MFLISIVDGVYIFKLIESGVLCNIGYGSSRGKDSLFVRVIGYDSWFFVIGKRSNLMGF